MSAPIYDLIAEELNLDPDRSRKLVRAMIREIRKRAHKGSGVRVPGLGAFRSDGETVVFQPEPSLARTVNRRFQGLDEESVASGGAESTDGGPTTITRGFEVGSWDPLDTGASDDTGSEESTSSSPPAPDTDEFQAPDTDEFDAPPEEVVSPEGTSEDADAKPEDSDAGAPDTAPTGEIQTGEAQPSEPAAGTTSGAETSSAAEAPDEDTSSRFDWQETSAAQEVQQETGSADATSGVESGGSSSPAPSASDADQPSAPEDRDVSDASDAADSDVEEPSFESPSVGDTSDEPGVDAPEPQRDAPSEADVVEDASEPPEIHDTRESTETPEADDAPVKEPEQEEPEQEEDDAFALPDTSDVDEDDEGPNIWESDFSWDLSSVSSEDVEDKDDAQAVEDGKDTPDESQPTGVDASTESGSSSPEPRSEPSQGADDTPPREPSRSIFDFDESDFESDAAGRQGRAETAQAQETPSQDAPTQDTGSQDSGQTRPAPDRPASNRGETQSSSRLPTVITVSVILLLVALGAWILLGQQGILPSPQETLGLGGDTAPRSQTATSAETGPSDDDASAAPGSSTSDASTSSSSPSEDASSSAGGTASAAGDQAFNRSQGGFTIVVASRTSEQAARDLLPDFRQRFSEQGYPVDLVSGTSNGVTRYRVGVGQFADRAEARTFLDQNQDRLPQGAWPIRIE